MSNMGTLPTPYRPSETEAADHVDANMLDWFALTVKPQHEKTATAALSHKGYETFLPVCPAARRWSDRVKRLELPLFPGYVFCRFEWRDRWKIEVTPSVRGVVSLGGRPSPVSPGEIRVLEAVMASGLNAEPHPYLSIGTVVQLIDGPLFGTQGILLQFKGVARIIVSVSLLQRSVAVEVDSGWVAPVSACQSPAFSGASSCS